MFPRSLSLVLSELESTVMLSLATSLSSGSLSLFYLAQHLGQIPSRLFGATIGQAAFPVLSDLNSSKDKEGFKNLLLGSLFQSLYLTVLVALIILVLRVPIIRLAFGSKQFPWRATIRTGEILAFLSPAIVAQSGIHILVRGFYSLQDTRTPLVISLFSITTSIALAFLGIYRFNWDILSLVIATSVASLFQFCLLLFLIGRRIAAFPWKNFWSWIVKLSLVTIFSGFSFWLSMKGLDSLIDTTKVLGLLALTIVSLITGVAVYFSLSLVLKIPETKILSMLFLFLKRKATLKNILAFSGRQIRKQEELIEPPVSH
jgi:putative peptidoglycan lipid II flippase